MRRTMNSRLWRTDSAARCWTAVSTPEAVAATPVVTRSAPAATKCWTARLWSMSWITRLGVRCTCHTTRRCDMREEYNKE